MNILTLNLQGYGDGSVLSVSAPQLVGNRLCPVLDQRRVAHCPTKLAQMLYHSLQLTRFRRLNVLLSGIRATD